LSEQPESVRKLIAKDTKLQKMIDDRYKYRESYLKPKFESPYSTMSVDDFNRLKEPTGQDLYEMAQSMNSDSFGFPKGGNSQAAGSEFLNSLGIKGIKYFDGSSRAAGEGTRNLVVFDDSIIKTLKRNGEDILPDSVTRQSGLLDEDIVPTDTIPEMLKRQSGI
jgi:hypothetical protein